MGGEQPQKIVNLPRVNPNPLVDTGKNLANPLGKVSIYNLNVNEAESKLVHSKTINRTRREPIRCDQQRAELKSGQQLSGQIAGQGQRAKGLFCYTQGKILSKIKIVAKHEKRGRGTGRAAAT